MRAKTAEARRLADAEARANPVTGRRCAACGRYNYALSYLGNSWRAGGYGPEYVPVPVGFVFLGGRWLCPGCAPKRPARRAAGADAVEYRVMLPGRRRGP